jgi:NAD+ diphosphatase
VAKGEGSLVGDTTQSIWIGFYHGVFLVPSAWVKGELSERLLEDRLVEMTRHLGSGRLPTEWQSIATDRVFPVGFYQGIAVNVIKLQSDAPAAREDPPTPEGYHVADLRAYVGKVSSSTFALLSRAAQLLRWDKTFQFCPGCGTAFEPWRFGLSGAMSDSVADGHSDRLAEMVKKCSACGIGQYPRISPCILVLVTNTAGQVLLAQGVRHPSGFWSTLAGFIEAGESAEAAVTREVAEEVGIEVEAVEYRQSQSWPFPHALMLGFWAQAKTTALQPDPREIVAAKWYNSALLAREGMPAGCFLPPVGTLSRQLIDDYLNLNR